MNKSGAWVWAFYVGMSSLLSLCLGLALGYILFSETSGTVQIAETPAETISPSTAPANPETSEPSIPIATEKPEATAESPVTPKPQTELNANTETSSSKTATPIVTASDTTAASKRIDASRHLFIAVNGQWLADGTRQFLKDLKPGGVVLRPSNISTVEQTRALVNEIKTATGMGTQSFDLPLIATQYAGGPNNALGLSEALTAADIGASNNMQRAKKQGRDYGIAAKEFGVSVILGPSLDVYDSTTAFPNLQSRSFGSNQTQVAALGLAMAEGLRSAGVVSAATSFPGYAAAGYGADGISVVMNQDFNGLAKAMYPFSEATRSQMEGLVVGHIAIPALDRDNPTRSAALAPIIVTELLRNRWAFEGVILADEVAFNEMTRAHPAERAVVEALIAGCDAVIFLDPNPKRVQAVVDSIERAVAQGELSIEQLDASKERLENWRLTLGAIPLAPTEPMDSQIAMLQDLAGSHKTAQPEPEASQPALRPPTVQDTPKPIADPPPAPSEPSAEVEVAEVSPPAPILEVPETTEPVTVPTPIEPVVPEPTKEKMAAAVPEVTPEKVNAPETQASIQATEKAEPPEQEVTPKETKEVEAEPTPPSEPAIEETPAEEKPVPKARIKVVVSTKTLDPVPEEEPAESVKEDVETVKKADQPVEDIADNSANDVSETVEDMAKAVDETQLNRVKHKVAAGESLLQVAWKYDVSTEDILRWNSLQSMSVEEGTVLDIFTDKASEKSTPPESPEPDVTAKAPEVETSPAPKSTELKDPELRNKLDQAMVEINGKYEEALARANAPKAEPAPSATADQKPVESKPETPKAKKPEVSAPKEEETVAAAPSEYQIIHQVKWGDSLSTISSHYNVSAQNIRRWNDLKSDVLQANSSVQIFLPSEQAYKDYLARSTEGKTTTAVDKPKERTAIYTVAKGDTISKIVRKHNTTLDAITKLNKLKNPNNIFVGQKLKVPVTN